jgi:hypothetical protein
MRVGCMCISCYVAKATNTHSLNMEYLLLFLSEKRLHERASMLCSTHPACRVAHFFRRSVSALRLQHNQRKVLLLQFQLFALTVELQIFATQWP